MAWLQNLWEKLKGKGEPEEKQEKKKITLEQLKSELETEIKKNNNKILNIQQQIKQNTTELNTSLKEQIQTLQNINVDEKKEHEKIKLIVKENLSHYISYLEKLIEQFKGLTIDNEYIQKTNNILENFEKASRNSYEKATILIGKEIQETKRKIKNFSENINNIIIENKDVFEKQKTINKLKNILSKFEHRKNIISEIESSLENLQQNFKEIQKQKQEKEQTLKELKTGEEYEKVLKEKEKREREREKINQDFFKLKQEIDLKALSKHFHHDKKKSQIIKEHIENFKQALEANDSLINLIKEAEIEFGTEKIKNLILKDKEITLKETEIEKKAITLEQEIKKTGFRLLNMKAEIEQEKKKQEKFQEKDKQITEEIKNNASLLNIEIS